MAEAIKRRAVAHSFEGKVFTIVSCSTVSDEIVQVMATDMPDAEKLLKRRNSAFSRIVGPDGRPVGEPLIDREVIVCGEVDLGRRELQVSDPAPEAERFVKTTWERHHG